MANETKRQRPLVAMRTLQPSKDAVARWVLRATQTLSGICFDGAYSLLGHMLEFPDLRYGQRDDLWPPKLISLRPANSTQNFWFHLCDAHRAQSFLTGIRPNEIPCRSAIVFD